MAMPSVTSKRKARSPDNTNTASSGVGNLPLVPLSPIAQSYILCSNALKEATDKLTEAKKQTHHSDALPPIPVSVLRNLLETTKVESHRLKSLTRKMQSVEAATALYWNPDELAKQIAIVDSQLYNEVNLDKRSLLSVVTTTAATTTATSALEVTKLKHLLDFHHYLSHSFAHQIIYWVHLVNTYNPSTTSSTTAAAVIPPVVNPQHLNKENLLTHLIRVAYLLLHAYFDFSGFAAIMKALTFPEVRRLFHNTTGGNGNRKLSIWEHTSSRTKDMFRDLARIASSENNYEAYHRTFRVKLLEQQLRQQTSHLQHLQQRQQQQQSHNDDTSSTMIAIPWVERHLAKIKSIVHEYKAGDHVQTEDRFLSSFLGVGHHNVSSSGSSSNAVVLSAPGAHKLDMEVSILELSQRDSCGSELSLEDILKTELGTDASTETLLVMLDKTKKSNSKRSSLSSSIAASAKAIQIDGLRTATLPAANLRSLAPGKQLIHHWVVSRAYLTKEQLVSESVEVEPLRPGEQPLSPASSTDTYYTEAATDISNRNSMILPTAAVGSVSTSTQDDVGSNAASDSYVDPASQEDQPQEQELQEIKRKTGTRESEQQQQRQECDGQELQPIRKKFPVDIADKESSSGDDSDDGNEEPVEVNEPTLPTTAEPHENKASEEQTVETADSKDVIDSQQTDKGAIQAEHDVTDVSKEQDEGKEDDKSITKEVVSLKDEDREVELKEITLLDDMQKDEDTQKDAQIQEIEQQQVTTESVLSQPSTTTSKPKSSLSPTAPEFVPKQYKSTTTIATVSSKSSEEVWLGYPVCEEAKEVERSADNINHTTEATTEAILETESERWAGYPVPSTEDEKVEEGSDVGMENDGHVNDNVMPDSNSHEEDEDEVWKGYPGPNSSTDSPRRASSQSETSEEWKGYHATKMEADWQRESALKVQEHEWQGYTLETLDEDELDSSTMMNGEFGKSRQARHENPNLYPASARR